MELSPSVTSECDRAKLNHVQSVSRRPIINAFYWLMQLFLFDGWVMVWIYGDCGSKLLRCYWSLIVSINVHMKY